MCHVYPHYICICMCVFALVFLSCHIFAFFFCSPSLFLSLFLSFFLCRAQGVSLHLVRKFARHLLRALAFLSLPQVRFENIWSKVEKRFLAKIKLESVCHKLKTFFVASRTIFSALLFTAVHCNILLTFEFSNRHWTCVILENMRNSNVGHMKIHV